MLIFAVNDENLIKIVEALAIEIWTEHYTPIIGENQVKYMLETFQSEKAITSQIKDGYFYYLIGDKENYFGYFSFIIKNNHIFLSKIYIKSEYRGRGFGKKIMDFVEKTALENNLAEIVLTVNKNNLSSIKSYEKYGFVIDKEIVTDIGNGFFMDDYLMKKS
jgi:ribosomal protein S18 acetylase RimI-like enzyme